MSLNRLLDEIPVMPGKKKHHKINFSETKRLLSVCQGTRIVSVRNEKVRLRVIVKKKVLWSEI